MDMFFIDGASCCTAMDVHRTLKIILGLPDYYGANADALNDCLGERRPIRLCVMSAGSEEVARELNKLACVVRDNGGEVIGL